MTYFEDLAQVLYQADWLEAHLLQADAFEFLTDAIHTMPLEPRLWARRAEVLKNVTLCSQAEQDLQTALDLYQHQINDPWRFAQTHSQSLILKWSQARCWAEIETELLNYQYQHLKPMQSASSRVKASGPLKIGYVSADFRMCSAAILLEMLFLHHPQNDFEIHGYSLTDYPHDLAQQQFKQLIPHWHDISNDSLELICEKIQADQIDVLVDLAGHTSLSPLAILGRQVAPVQITGLTFNGPVGLYNQTWRLSDPIATPEALLDEKLAYLDSWIWWPEPELIPGKQVSDVPFGARKIGCAHHPGRLSSPCIAIWSELLHDFPQIQLHLKHRLYGNAWCRQQMLVHFKLNGIDSHRIVFEASSDYFGYLSWYCQLDLVLDPFPYHGGLVSCEALWMGLPVVTLSEWMKGGESILNQIQWPYGIAKSPAHYLQCARDILSHHHLRKDAARNLRPALQQSSISSGECLARQLCRVYMNAYDQPESNVLRF